MADTEKQPLICILINSVICIRSAVAHRLTRLFASMMALGSVHTLPHVKIEQNMWLRMVSFVYVY